MILGIGIDIASIERVRAAIARHGERFVRRILSETERESIASRFDRAQAVAARFAAKESTVKALGGPMGIAWHDIQVLHDPSGAPRIELSGVALRVAQSLAVARIFVSITHDAGVAAAVVILEGKL